MVDYDTIKLYYQTYHLFHDPDLDVFVATGYITAEQKIGIMG